MVYLARDLRHDRLVALKVLRPELAAVIGAARFLAEIKTTANLQHPHILPLHDSGEADGTVFYVMPYVEGETLRERILHEKQLPVEESVKIAKEIAGALDYAHRHGVVHRDIKPENILLHDGQALVADFGISLAVSRSDGGTRMTETGMSLGTPHYMAPEQAMGEREITAKADIYALGCVLYEMLTGEPPFTGTTAQQIIARAVTESPRPITMHRHTVPVHVEATTLKALEKLPADRFASAADFAAALDNPALTASAAAMVPGEAGRARGWRAKAAVPLAVVAALALVALGWSLSRPAPAAPLTRFALDFPASAAPMAERPIAISRDGAYLAYTGPSATGAWQIWLKARDRETPTPLVGTTNALSFTFSPDGRWIAFTLTAGELRKIPIIGGAPIPLADRTNPQRGLAWLENGTIVFVGPGNRRLFSIPDAGGTPTPIWVSDSLASPRTAFFPYALPGGEGLLFTGCIGGASCPEGLELRALDLRSGKDAIIATGVNRAEYAATGHLIYVNTSGALLAQEFDLKSLRTRGAPAPLLDSIANSTGFSSFALTRDGTLVTRRGFTAGQASYELAWVDRGGGEVGVDSSFRFRNVFYGANAGWSLSPDGTMLAIGLNTRTGDNLWVKQLPRGPLSRITLDSLPAFRPRWSRDGKALYYHSRREDNNVKYFRRAANGTGKEELIFQTDTAPGIFEVAWAADGKTMVLRAGGTVATVGGRDIMIAVPGVDSAPKPLVADPQFDEAAFALSPDGRWIVYESNETGNVEVYVRPFPAVETGKWQVSVDGGRAPLWARNGRELFYVNGARAMVAVPFAANGTTPQLGARNTLFTLRPELYLAAQENYTPFDISPDGQRFLMARQVRESTAPQQPLVVTENWFTELRERVARP